MLFIKGHSLVCCILLYIAFDQLKEVSNVSGYFWGHKKSGSGKRVGTVCAGCGMTWAYRAGDVCL